MATYENEETRAPHGEIEVKEQRPVYVEVQRRVQMMTELAAAERRARWQIATAAFFAGLAIGSALGFWFGLGLV